MFDEIFEGRRPVLIAVLHLPPMRRLLIDDRTYIEELIAFAIGEGRKVEAAGFDAILIENYGDSPFMKRVRDLVYILVFSTIVRELVKELSIPIGVNLLRNSALEAYAIAYSVGARFIRVNAFVETLVTDSGIIEPAAPHLAKLRTMYRGVAIFADILCKHATSLYYEYLKEKIGDRKEAIKHIVLEAAERGHADAIIVTGVRTGAPPDLDTVKYVRSVSPVPILVGSGLDPENATSLLKYADGAIVGSYIRVDGRAGNPIDVQRAQKLINIARSVIRR